MSADKPLVRDFTEADWDGFSNCREFYGGHPPLISNVNYQLGDYPVLLIGDHTGLRVVLTGDREEETIWLDIRGREHHPFVIQAVMEKMLRDNVQEEDLVPLGFVKM
jgi:hypothetical protein